ncbi:hypothetical protein FXE87_00960 [Vibrio mimicus]|uniref:hypothetical protein n=1 Tax=Vibrio mimicus TaxID=674 RepID=UPI0011D73EF7|nr:hypothetical protein [Vibrio mimicus]TXY30583.1 hypothetical protein FXE87_00960 [Vibrio mimicus]
MAINRSHLTSVSPTRFWGWLEVLFTFVPLFIFSLAAMFLWEGWQQWSLVNQLVERGDVAIGRVIETEYRRERSSTGIYNQRLVCLVEYRTSEGKVIRQWELDGVDCHPTYQLVPPKGDVLGGLVPIYVPNIVSYLPDAPIRASADLELTRGLAKIDFGIGVAGLLLGLFVGYFCLPLLKISWAESRNVPILKYLGQQQNYAGIISLLETYKHHPASNVLVWEAARHIGHCRELYPCFVSLFEQMQSSPSKKKLEPVDETIAMISFYRLSSLGFHELSLAMLARHNQVLSCQTLATFILITRTKQLPFTLTLSAEKLKACKELCYAKELKFGLEDERYCYIDVGVRLNYLLWLMTLVFDNTDVSREATNNISSIQTMILEALKQIIALQTINLDRMQALMKQIQSLLTRFNTSHGFQRELKLILELIHDKMAQSIQQQESQQGLGKK